jgi:hypothetical protein
MGTRSSDVIPEYWRGPALPLPGRLLIVMSARSHVAPEALARGERAIHVGALLQGRAEMLRRLERGTLLRSVTITSSLALAEAGVALASGGG